MKALVCEQHGAPETLVYRDAPLPSPGPKEIRIRMQAAGVNFPDSLIIRDMYQTKPGLPFSPGSELAGTVDAVGSDVSGFAEGDRVTALTTYGAFAEYAIAAEAEAFAIPDAVAFDVAAAFTLAYGTSFHALKQRAQLRPGETVLVLGASGGVGLAAVEIAKAMGAHVIAGASSEEKLMLVRAHGADETINYAAQDLKPGIMELTRGKGVDVIYDPVGDALAEPAFRTMAWGGRYLVIGFAGGKIPAIPLNLPLVKGAAIVGVFWGAFARHQAAENRANMDELYRLLSAGKLRPHIARRFPLAEGAQAIRWMMDRKAQGKIILTS